MSALREVFVSFTSQFDGRGVREGNQQTQGLIQRFQGLRGAIMAAAPVVATLAIANWARDAAGAVGEFVNEMRTLGDELGDTSARLGIATDDLQVFRFAAQLNGVEVGELDGAFSALNRSIAAASNSAQSTQGRAFRALGVSLRDANGELRPMGDLFNDLVGPISAIASPTERNNRLLALFGRQGANLGPLFSQGAEGIEQARAAFERMGGGASAEMIEQAGKLDNALVNLDLTILGLKSRLAVTLLPVVERGVELFGELVNWFNQNRTGLNLLKAAFLGLITVLGAFIIISLPVWGPLVLAVLLFVAALAAVGLVVQDLIVWFQGGNSVIGEFIEQMTGLSPDDLRIAWVAFTMAIEDTFEALRRGYNAVAGLVGLPTIGGGSTPRDAGTARRAGTGGLNIRDGVQGFLASVPGAAASLTQPGELARRALTTVTQTIPITISGVTDPIAVGREVRRHLDRANRDAIEAHGQ